MIKKAENTNQSHFDILVTLKGENKSQRNFDGNNRDGEGFMDMDLMSLLLHVIATDAERNKEPYILS